MCKTFVIYQLSQTTRIILHNQPKRIRVHDNKKIVKQQKNDNSNPDTRFRKNIIPKFDNVEFSGFKITLKIYTNRFVKSTKKLNQQKSYCISTIEFFSAVVKCIILTPLFVVFYSSPLWTYRVSWLK